MPDFTAENQIQKRDPRFSYGRVMSMDGSFCSMDGMSSSRPVANTFQNRFAAINLNSQNDLNNPR